ncbi:MAG: hypothetical protein FWD53_07665 [Phycisphaerales bacterium]|nr:hypothetical protein [Phycisphaerales bacterium]
MTTTAATPTSPTTAIDLEARVAELEAQVAELRREQEFERVAKKIRIGREQADRGQTYTMEEVAEHMSKKYGLPRPKWMTDAT